MLKINYLLLLALTWAALTSAGEVEVKDTGSKDGSPLIHTNINLFGAKMDDALLHESHDVVIDPSNIVDEEALVRMSNDVEEDENDRFISSRTGKRRPTYQQGVDSQEWSEEAGVPSTPGKALSRVKRCGGGGGGGGDDDGGDANRSRRSRRSRNAQSRRAKKNRAKKNKAKQNKAKQNQTTTTVTRKVIQNGQVVSETQQPAAQPMIIQQQPTVQAVAPQQVPQVVQQVNQPIVQHVNPAAVQPSPIQAPQHVQVAQAPQVVQAPQVAQTQQPPAAGGVSASGSFKLAL